MTRTADATTEIPVEEVLPAFADAFPFERFNAMQSEVVPTLLESSDNVVVSAPTASGKTAVAEVAICDTIAEGGTALFLAPLRALTNEKEREWERFEALGYAVEVVTGERELTPGTAGRADILVMTPEKADSATRKYDTRRYDFITDIDCCIIDEVHLLDADDRGSVLEVTIARLRRLCNPRIVALSATMSNVDDVAAWLDAPAETTFSFGDEYRPVPLEADVSLYTHGENAFADKYRRLYRALDLAEPHIREDGQALVFVASRQDTVQAAKKTRDELPKRDIPAGLTSSDRESYDTYSEEQDFSDDTLRQSVIDGVGFHNAGLSRSDKNLVEKWFREGLIDVLFSTSTLAWGVNLPARCVVIRDTTRHDPLEGETEMSPLDVLQMLGRAGRPGYDDRGYAWVVCDGDSAERYQRLLRRGKDIESRLVAGDNPATSDLATHINAEIALGTIRDIDDALAWLEETYYAVRAKRTGAHEYASDAALRTLVSDTIDWLAAEGFIQQTETAIEPTTLGRLASDYYLDLSTANRFADLPVDPDERTILRTVARAAEFESVSARSDEEGAIDAVLGDEARDLDPGNRKVLAILESATRGTTPSELRSDAWVIRQNALRLIAALGTIVDNCSRGVDANAVRRVEARVETGVSVDAVGLTAIDGVGQTRAQKLAAAGYASPAAVSDASPEALTAAGIEPTVAKRIHDRAGELPRVSIDWGALPETINRGERSFHEVAVRTTGGDARAWLSVAVNGQEMTTQSTYLGKTTLPLGVFGGDPDELEFTITVAFPELPLAPDRQTRVISVTDYQ